MLSVISFSAISISVTYFFLSSGLPSAWSLFCCSPADCFLSACSPSICRLLSTVPAACPLAISFDRRSLFTSFTRCTTSKRRALPGMPYALRAGDTARQIVFSVRVGSATTRLVVRASFPLSLHSTDA